MSMDKSEPRRMVIHTIDPVYDANSRVLILGSIPSPKSRESGFYYGHPQNRFWKVLSALFGEDIADSPDEKRRFLLRRRIAMWDVLHSCEIRSADDNSIRDPIPNDFSDLLATASLRAVFTTGRKATDLYRRHLEKGKGLMPSRYLPSTSPANCRLSMERLVTAYQVILTFLQ